jgi:hypothetical protein
MMQELASMGVDVYHKNPAMAGTKKKTKLCINPRVYTANSKIL